MTIPVVAFFNNKGRVGQTMLVYHLAWMYADLGLHVVAADLDPQANLTSAFLDEDRLEQLWPDGPHTHTIFGCLQPLQDRTADIAEPHVENISDIDPSLSDQAIGLLVGDLLLSSFEDDLSNMWPPCLEGDPHAFRVISAFWRIMQKAAEMQKADIILMDLGPNLSAINRSALIASDYVVVPLSPDLFSLQGLRNLGPTLRRWRSEWKKRLEVNPAKDLPLPEGLMQPIGYIVLQHTVRLDRPVKAYDRWIARIPDEYREHVLNEQIGSKIPGKIDPNCLALLRNYRSLMPLAQEAHKPMFYLKPADGAMGSHMQAVQSAYTDFNKLAGKIAKQSNIPVLSSFPQSPDNIEL